jgi:hypothetical protein
MKTLFKLSLIALTLAFLMPAATRSVGAQGKHPSYLHALSDLRDARAHLQRPDGGALRDEEKSAIGEIDEAIRLVKAAAIEDGKNIDDHVPVDNHLDWTGRLHRARELLDKAHGDVAREEDDPNTRGLQRRVLDHIDHAHAHVDAALAVVSSH